MGSGCLLHSSPGGHPSGRAAHAGPFDPRFFLYYEEVDLCRRIKAAGYTVWYWPDIVIVHIGGESSRKLKSLQMSRVGAQLTLWRMRSMLLYYRKHHGLSSLGTPFLEVAWSHFRAQAELMEQAWK